MNARLALLVLTVGAVAATEVAAQNQYQQQITDQMARRIPRMAELGFTPVGSANVGTLNDDADTSYPITVTAGTRYAVAAVCDNDCSDIDLEVFASDGTRVAQDIDTDDQPLVSFTATNSGRYRVRVMMPACNTSPCYYGVQLFTGGGK